MVEQTNTAHGTTARITDSHHLKTGVLKPRWTSPIDVDDMFKGNYHEEVDIVFLVVTDRTH